MLKGHIRKFHNGHIFICPYCNMSVRHRNSIRRHLENRHGELHQEWSTPGFIDKLQAGDNSAPANVLVNASLVIPDPQSASGDSTAQQHISPNMAQTDDQTEGTSCYSWSKCTVW
jgi:uncharacterized C2H2 Zn-finger protein